jgi:phosphomannomutase
VTDLYERVEAWLADEVDERDAADLRHLLAAARRGEQRAGTELIDRFASTLEFGTAGLRGPIRSGPNGMNAAVVRRAAAGVAEHLAAHGLRGRPVVVGYDGRHRSHEFALDSAAVFAAAGFQASVMPRLLPTPVLAFAVQHLKAAAGVMVTASHNPPADNGYKVYAADGAQIITPADVEIEAAINAITSVRAIPMAPEQVAALDEAIVRDYVAAVSGLVEHRPRALKIVHTAMHGVGTEVLTKVFAAAGFAPLRKVVEQAAPDPDFPTVSFPNPEEPGAMDLALALARQEGADLILANDPDADRCAVGVPTAAGWRMLTGDEVGVLLADHLMRSGVRGTYATTIVSSSMLATVAAANGVGYAETLTGFKWISRAAPDLVFGYEEALGYAVAPRLVRDKDGISAALLVADCAARLVEGGSTIEARLEELAGRYGRHSTGQWSVRVGDLALIETAMARLRSAPPATLLGRPVEVHDLAPDADVVRLGFEGGRVVVRPSGTEPKLKAYLEVVTRGSAAEAAALLDSLRTEVALTLDLTPVTG